MAIKLHVQEVNALADSLGEDLRLVLKEDSVSFRINDLDFLYIIPGTIIGSERESTKHASCKLETHLHPAPRAHPQARIPTAPASWYA